MKMENVIIKDCNGKSIAVISDKGFETLYVNSVK